MSSLLEVRRIIPQSVAVSRHKTSGPSDQSRGRTWRTLGSTWSSSRVISAEESETRETNMDTTSDQRKCHNCGQGGHLRRDCPEAPSQEGGFGSYNSAYCRRAFIAWLGANLASLMQLGIAIGKCQVSCMSEQMKQRGQRPAYGI
ncbi:hypothetical protein PC118_g11865 [Phytophthora cactorum]|uniref:CCHC-type domain-containing protein n=1 Tax=Phytophthora cactorum TaxID=29920 RepID=A0A8T1FST5_9STRA|nr:hypothetical protein PC118_g11865 [Phytophthora cactorum]